MTWIREDGLVMSTQLTPEEIEEWFELQNEELDALDQEDNNHDTTSTEAESSANGNGEEAKQPKNNSERVKLGRACEFSECTCGHKGCSIPLSSHSDWCDYKLWKESLVKKSEDYRAGIFF